MGLLALSALILMGSGVLMMRNNLKSLKPGVNKMEETFIQLEDQITIKQSELAPLGEVNIELLSANESKNVLKSRISGIEMGVISTLFNEPGIAFALKKFKSNDLKAMMVAKDRNHLYRFLFKNNEIEIVIDNQALGIYYQNEKILKGIRSGSILAQLNEHSAQGESLFVQGKEMVLFPKDIFKNESQVAQRVYVVLNQEISAEEQATILAITTMLFCLNKKKI